ncbi:hypothetical protein AB2T96_01335 [Clostridium butyricum]|uniref:hypothetical protein n=1 Tax=Clostridium TaxID=1485 RepID=UPI0002CBA085|nr:MULTISPECIES: hypothetical protein [Clostridium]EMU54452.1 hypothetical protein CBDKU1_16200 [Clostridium butyricum DKU-01]MBS4839619.1 hypothetical protein [Clostridium sp.]MDB2158749.1 hypothetical protein [Clostridium butyricum]MDU1400768.1 hypothetical protein [Clostridium sp.]MDU1602603.1 hypothetical protein [Clostridium sp.]
MSINNITGNYGGYLNSLSMMNSEVNGTYSSKNSVEKYSDFKDILDISTSRKNLSSTNAIGGITLDKGTAANTTLYVDRSTFDQIVNYMTSNPESNWEELGMDDEKRWIVVNGQRFECPLSKAEKEAIRRAKKGLIGMLDEADKEREKQDSVKLNFDKNNKIKLNGDVSVQLNDKIINLMNNDNVMNTLTSIMQMNGGQGIKLSL